MIKGRKRGIMAIEKERIDTINAEEMSDIIRRLTLTKDVLHTFVGYKKGSVLGSEEKEKLKDFPATEEVSHLLKIGVDVYRALEYLRKKAE